MPSLYPRATLVTPPMPGGARRYAGEPPNERLRAARPTPADGSGGSPGPARLAGVPPLDGFDQLALRHLRPGGDVEPLGHLGEMLLRGPLVDTAPRLVGPPRPGAAPCRLRVRGTLALLGLPVVADLLEGVLEGAIGRLVGPAALAVLLRRVVVRLGEGVLGLLGRAPQGRGQLALLGMAACSGLRHYDSLLPFDASSAGATPARRPL